MLLHIGKNLSKARRWQISLICYRYSREFWGGDGATSVLFCNVYLHVNLETVFPALKVTQNFVFTKIYEQFGFWRTGNLIIYGFPSLLQTYCVCQTILPISKLFSELRKTWMYNRGSYSKILMFHLFHELGKTRASPARATLKNLNFFVNWWKIGSTA